MVLDLLMAAAVNITASTHNTGPIMPGINGIYPGTSTWIMNPISVTDAITRFSQKPIRLFLQFNNTAITETDIAKKTKFHAS